MQLNKLVFQCPQPSYSIFHPKLIYIPLRHPVKNSSNILAEAFIVKKQLQQSITVKIKQKNVFENVYKQNKKQGVIPCLFIESKSKIMLLYFHASGEDIGHCEEALFQISKVETSDQILNLNVLIVEYPGYGIYKYQQPSSDVIQEDAQIVYEWVIERGWKVAVMGRSIGCGVAVHIASRKSVQFVILMCPFTSIRNLIRDLIGNIISCLVKDRFKNDQKIKKIKSPILFLHGKKDKMISFEESVRLKERCSHGRTMLYLGNYVLKGQQMSHNRYDLFVDFLIPVKQFCRKMKLSLVEVAPKIEFPKEFYFCPFLQIGNNSC